MASSRLAGCNETGAMLFYGGVSAVLADGIGNLANISGFEAMTIAGEISEMAMKIKRPQMAARKLASSETKRKRRNNVK